MVVGVECSDEVKLYQYNVSIVINNTMNAISHLVVLSAL